MRRYYGGILSEIPDAAKGALVIVEGTIAFVVFLALLFNPEWVTHLGDWGGVHRLWAVVPVAILFVHLLFRASYLRYAQLEAVNDDLRKQIDNLSQPTVAVFNVSGANARLIGNQVTTYVEPSVLARPELPAGDLRGLDFRIVDLVQDGMTVRGRTIERCTLRGPAMIILTEGTELTGCTFPNGTPEDVYIALDQGQTRVRGVVAFAGCSIRDSTLINVGVIGAPDTIRQYRALPPVTP